MWRRLRELIWGPRDDSSDDRFSDEAAHLLEVDEPMAGAGALLSGTHHKSETEKALERAADADKSEG